MRTRALLLLSLLSAGCTSLPPVSGPPARAPWPSFRMVVFSDPHVLAPSLVPLEDDWKRIEAGSFQMLRESAEILDHQVTGLREGQPDLVLVTGDLTKDGERESHRLVASQLARLSEAGIPVLVIPGNHDVRNPQARGGSVTATEFATLYGRAGYDRALSRDPASLSYLAEPVPGLRILALDTARYEDNRTSQVTAGRIRTATWPWIDRMLAEARRDGVPVAVMMHHGLVEKFEGQSGLFADYLVADRREVGRRLAVQGVQVVFSGHFHSLSIAGATYEGHRVLDIEGGTLSQYPFGFRRVVVEGGRLRVTTDYVTDLPSWGDRPGQFYDQARERARTNSAAQVAQRLLRAGVGLPDAQALSRAFGEGFAAVTEGDPQRPGDWLWPPPGLGPMGWMATVWLGDLPHRLWLANPPQDRTLDTLIPLP